MKYIAIFLTVLLLVSCDPPSVFTHCSYYYPIHSVGLDDTIKTTDTIWIETDIDAKLCLVEGIYVNGAGNETPNFYKLVGDTFISIRPTLILNDSVYVADSIYYDYDIPITYVNGRYKSPRYGILFPEPGIYGMTGFHCLIENGKDASIFIHGYFDVPSNNMNLFPANVKIPAWEIGVPCKYFVYFLQVIE